MESLPNQPFYSIAEAARILGVSPTTLRRWESEGRIEPVRTIGGDRRYSPQDVQKVLHSFRKEADLRYDPPAAEPADPPASPPPLVPIRRMEDYRPFRRKNPLRSLAVLAAVALLALGFFNFLPELTRTRLERALTTGPADPIVDVNDVAEYRIQESGEVRLGFKLPTDIGALFVKSLNVAEDAILGTGRFLGTVFFGKTKKYYVTPVGDASFNSVTSNTGQVASLEVQNLLVTGSSSGIDAGVSSWADLTGKPVILSSLNNVSNNGGNVDLVAGTNITISPDSVAKSITISAAGFSDADTLDGQDGTFYLDFPGFTSLLADYGFTDNSGNWNTAYGWGDHSLVGYLTDITGESVGDLADVTITLAETGDYLRFDGASWVDVGISQILTDLLTVDGDSSGLDADLLDGQEGTYYLDLDNQTGTCTDCLTTAEIDESTFTGLNSSNIDDIYLFNTGDTIAGNLTFEKTGIADAGTQYPSYDLVLRGSGWNTTTSADVDLTGRIRLVAGSGAAGAIPYRIGIFDNTPTEFVTFDLLNQRVGIGIENPSYKLTVNGKSNFLDDVVMTTSSNIVSNSTGIGWTMAGGTAWNSGGAITLFGPTGAVNNGILFRQNGTEIARFDDIGNFGIGDTTPDGLLDVELTGAKTAGAYALNLSNLATNSTTDGINKYGAYITSTGLFDGLGGTATNNWGLYVDTVSGADNNYGAYFADSVGIGTNAPSAKLDILSASNNHLRLSYDASNYWNMYVDGGKLYMLGTGATAGLYLEPTDDIFTVMNGKTFYLYGSPGAISLSLGTPAAEGGDLAVYRDGSGNQQFYLDANAAQDAVALTLYGGVQIQGTGTNDIAGTLNLSGGALTSTGALTITPGAGNNLNISLSGTGDLAVNTDQLYVDTDAGTVGIGTAVPGGKLHVYSSSAGAVSAQSLADDLVVENSAEVGISLLGPDDKYGYIIFGSPSDSANNLIYAKYNTGLFVQTGSTLRLSLDPTETVFHPNMEDIDVRFTGITDANLLFVDAGENRVGIGTNLPGEKLGVAGSILLTSINDQLKFADDGYITSIADNYIQLQSGGTTEFKVADRVPYIIQYTDTFNYANFNLQKTNVADAGTQYPSYDLKMQGSGWDTTTLAAVDLTGTVRLIAGSGATGAIPYRIGIFDNTPTEWAVFDLLNQRLGIDTTSPVTTLTLGNYQTASQVGLLVQNGTPAITSKEIIRMSSNNTLTYPTTGGLTIYNDDITASNRIPALVFGRRSNTTYASAIAAIDAIDMGQGQDANWRQGALAFHTADNSTTALKERMRIDNNGSVGIGDTTPDGKLDVEPTGAVTTAAGATALTISNLTTNSTTALTKYGAYITSTGTFDGGAGATNNYGLYVDTVSGADSNYGAYFAGNVGISVTNPAYKLDTNGDIRIGQYIRTSNNSVNAINMYNAGISLESYLSARYNLDNDNNDSAESYEIRTNGNQAGLLYVGQNGAAGGSATPMVGIGTSSPQSVLTVMSGSLNPGTAEATNRGVAQIFANPSSATGGGGLEFKSSASGSGYGWSVSAPDLTAGNTPLVFASRANSASWSEVMRVTNAGLVGINTTSSIDTDTQLKVIAAGNRAARFHIPTLASGISGILVSTDETSNTTDYFLGMVSDLDGTPDPEFTFRIDGSAYADTTWTTPATDFAEYFPTNFTALEPGNLVSLDSSAEGKVKPAVGNERHALVGVISTSPGFIGGIGDDMSHENDPNYKVVGLLGQVPTLVSTENGPIEVGDSITVSSISGVGTKATSAGRVVGQALESYRESGVGKILVFVNSGWYDPGVVVDSSGAAAQANPDGSTTQIASPTIEAEEGIFERITATILGTFEKIIAKTAEIASAFIKSLTVESLAVKGESVGQAVIPSGKIEVSVAYPDLTETDKVFFTLNRAVAVGVEKTPGTGFKFILAAPADLPVTIDYWIVE